MANSLDRYLIIFVVFSIASKRFSIKFQFSNCNSLGTCPIDSTPPKYHLLPPPCPVPRLRLEKSWICICVRFKSKKKHLLIVFNCTRAGRGITYVRILPWYIHTKRIFHHFSLNLTVLNPDSTTPYCS